PHHRRQSRCFRRSGYLGHHILRSRQRCLCAPDGLADATLRGSTHFRTVDTPVYPGLVSVRDRLEPAYADPVPRAAGWSVRPDDSWLAGAATVAVSSPEEGYSARDLVGHHAGGADLRPDPRRLHL